MVRFLALLQTVLIVFSGSPPLLAITMGQLRSGGVPMAGGGRGSAPNLQNAGAESAQRTAELARQSQLKSEEALKAMEKLQETARVTASAETQIKNGLSADFLHPHDGFRMVEGKLVPVTTSWKGANIDMTKTTAIGTPGDHHVEIKQSEQNAYLYWKNFNVGPRTTINFNQSAGGADKTKWIAFNKITGTASPTSIYGKIKADGQVYILNQNGIMVHNGAEVNVHSLVASTLPINGNLAGDYDPRLSKNLQLEGRGIANNPDRQFLFSALEMKPAAAVSGSERFVPRVDTIEKEGVRMEGAGAWVDENGALKSASGDPLAGKTVFGNVEVERGAQLTVGGASSSSGLLLLAAPNVINEGKISAPQGQVILASGLQVGVAPHDANDPSLRGLDVTIGKVLAQLANPGITVTPVSAGLLSPLGRDYGTAWQGGLILAPSGNLTMAGADVSHQGVTLATTSVSLNGRIDLLANYGAELNPDYNDDGSKGEPVLRKGAGLVRIGSFDDALGIPRASLIAVLPDWSSGEVIEGSRLAINSLVSVMGGNISMGSDAMIWAPGASSSRFAVGETRSQTGEILTKGVTLSAGSWEDYGNTTAQPEDRAPFFLHDSGSIHLAAGSVIDVAGSTGIKVDGAQNYLKVQLRGPELANSPLQRQSPIRGKDITVDIRISGEYDGQYWVGTPLGDVTGYLGLIRRSVGELTIDGGTIGMEAGESISLGRDSLLNVSGGWKEYGGGSFKQTMIRYRNQLIPIWQATPDRVYDGIAPFDYKITDKAYIEGGNGGNIMLQAASLGLDGQLQGLTVLGERQLRVAPDLLSSRPPSRSGLEIHVIAQKYEPRVTSAGVSGTKFALNVSPYTPAIRFESGRGESLPGFDMTGLLPSSRQQLILLDPSAIKGSGFGRLVLENHDGMVILPAGSVLDLGVRGFLGIEASRIDFGGSVLTPAGSISLSASTLPYDLLQQYNLPDSKRPDLSPLALYRHPSMGLVLGFGDASALPGETIKISTAQGLKDGTITEVTLKDLTLADAGSISLRAGSAIDVSGLGIDDFFSLQQVPLVALEGGDVTMKARQLDLEGRIDVSGGYHIPPASNLVRYADAGSIVLHGVSDPDLVTLRGGMNLGAKLSGHAGFSPISLSGKPGLLDIKAPAIRIANSVQNAEGILGLAPTFFDQGGFGTFRLSGIGLPGGSGGNPSAPGVEVTGNTVINPSIMRYRVERRSGVLSQTYYLPGGDMGHAASLSLSSEGLFDDNLTEAKKFQFRGVVQLGEGSAITLDPKVHSDGSDPVASLGQIWINMSEDGTASSPNSVTAILGDLTARGGSIRIGGSDKFPEVEHLSPKVTVDLGSDSQIRVDGTALYLPDPRGLRNRFGIMADAGEIQVRGAVAAREGSLLSADGSSALFDDLGSVSTRRLDGSGGNISLMGGDLLFIDSRLSAASGGITGLGGSLKISSARFISPRSPALPQVNEPNNPLSDADTIAMRLSMRIFASGSALGTEFAAASDTSVLGRASQSNGGISEKGGGAIATSRFSAGGFDQLELSGNLLIEDEVSLRSGSILRVASGSRSGGILSAVSRVTLEAPYVSVGMDFEAPLNTQSEADKFRNETAVFGNQPKNEYYAPPVWGDGTIIVNASRAVDLGNVSFQRIGSVQINTPGVIRGNGTMAVAGDLMMKAAQIEAVSDASFRAIAFDHRQEVGNGSVVEANGASTLPAGVVKGSITILGNGTAAKPLSAGGSLSLFARELTIGGSLVAPFGSIILGNDGTVTSIDPVSGVRAPYTETLNVNSGARIAVSGSGLDINYGTSSDGTIWLAPSSKDITAEGTPGKSIRLMGGNLSMLGDLDLSGGGALSAIRWISGLGGKINLLGSPTGDWSPDSKYAAGDLVSHNGHTWSARSDSEDVEPEVGLYWTRLPESYAIIPGYSGSVSPTGYGEGQLGVGSGVWLRPGNGFSGGSYVLLPAAYATQPGAYLVTLESSQRATQQPLSFLQEDGTLLLTGSYHNPLSPSRSIPRDTMLFSIASSGLVSRMAEYRRLDADAFFTQRSIGWGNLPRDAGTLWLQSGSKLSLAGRVSGLASSGGFGARVDVSVAAAALMVGGNAVSSPGAAWINPNLLVNSSTGPWTFGSILLGGTRLEAAGGRSILTVTASSIAIADGVGISSPDVILASRGGIDIGDGVAISTGSVKRSVIDKEIAVTGNGSLIRVSSDDDLELARSGASVSDSPGITIRERDPFKITSLMGLGILLDSTTLNSSLTKDLVLGSTGNASSSGPMGSITINSGLLNLLGSDFQNPVVDGSPLFSITGPSISGKLMKSLQGAKSLRLQSYGDLNLYGSTLTMNPGTDSEGMFGDAGMSLTIGAPSIRGRGQDGGSFAFRAADVHIGNPLQGDASGDSLSPDGILEINASRIFTGSDDFMIKGFSAVSLLALDAFVAEGAKKGTDLPSLSAGDERAGSTHLYVSTPMITGSTGAGLMMRSSGDLILQQTGIPSLGSSVQSGLAASIAIHGNSVSVGTKIFLPSGSFSASAGGNLQVGSEIDVSGSVAGNSEVPKALPGGTISLESTGGIINLTGGAILKMDAREGARAGNLSVAAVAQPDPDLGFEGGNFLIDSTATISAKSGTGGSRNLGGVLRMDLAAIPSTSRLAGDDSEGNPRAFSEMGFTREQSFRSRSGDLVLDDPGFIKAYSFTMTADQGSITVQSGSGIDASGTTGGSIALQASGSLVLQPNSYLTVHGDQFDASGAGGSILLSAGISTIRDRVFGYDSESRINLSGSYLDLGITEAPSRPDQRGGILHVRVPRLGGDDPSLHDLAISDRGLDLILDPAGTVFRDDGTPSYTSLQVTVDPGKFKTVQDAESALGRSFADIAAVNDLTSDGLLIGSTLNVGAGRQHTVLATDSVASLALRYQVAEESIRGNNDLLAGTGLKIGAELRSHTGASAVIVEGYQAYDLASRDSAGVINATARDLRQIVRSDAEAFFGAAGSDSESISATRDRILSDGASRLAGLLVMAPGVEVVNATQSGESSVNSVAADLSLKQQLTGSGSSVRNSGDWDFSQFRVGSRSAPGFLTLRAAGNILLESSLSDGFQGSHNTDLMLDYNAKLPSTFQSWSFRLVAGADFSSVSAGAVVNGSSADIGLGSRTTYPFIFPGLDKKTSDALLGGFGDTRYYNYQMIRTGTGSIDLASSGKINLRNNMASIYTAGVIDPDQTLSGCFDLPSPNLSVGQIASGILGVQQGNPYKAQFSRSGGSISLEGGTDILRTTVDKNGVEIADSSRQLPSHWLYRRGSVDAESGKFEQLSPTEVASTSWWVDFSNFFQGVGALGGGNISLSAGRNIENVDAVIPTMLRMTGRGLTPAGGVGGLIAADQAAAIETGGGNLMIKTKGDLSGGSYYVERGGAQLLIGGGIISNATRDPSGYGVVTGRDPSRPLVLLPTTFFAGKGAISVEALGDSTIGPVANPFLTPQGINNGYRYRTSFSTYDDSSELSVMVLSGDLTMRTMMLTPDTGKVVSSLWWWMKLMSGTSSSPEERTSYYQPWTRLSDDDLPDQLQSQMLLLPSKVGLLSLSGDIRVAGDLTLNPASDGLLNFYAKGSVIGMNAIGYSQAPDPTKPAPPDRWYSSTINVSDAAPSYLPSVASPLSFRSLLSGNSKNDEAEYFSGKSATKGLKVASLASTIALSLSESGSYTGEYGSLARQLRLHDKELLSTRTIDPIRINADGGGITGLTLFSPKKAILEAAKDIGDVGLYLQNVSPSDQSIIRAGGSVNLWSQVTASQIEARAAQKAAIGNGFSAEPVPTLGGDVRIGGPGSLLIVAGGSIDLGNGPYNSSDGTGDGITSIGNARNPHLPFAGADIDLIAGLADLQPSKVSALFSLASGSPLAQSYFKQVLETFSQGGLTDWRSRTQTLGSFTAIRDSGETDSFKEKVAVTLFQIMLKQAGRDYNDSKAADYRTYRMGEKAVETLLGSDGISEGNITTWSRDIRTKNGGSISITAPGGGVTLANTAASIITIEPFSRGGGPSGGVATALPPGIVTAAGGAINIFTDKSVDLGIGRIFTLRGGDIMIWSDRGDIAAGASAKTVASAPPTRVLIDPQSASVLTDLAGLATGGGIGVLAAIPGVPVGNVDLIAPTGVIDAGDAGIRSTGNLNLAATKILNADNILAGGVTVGAPPPAAPSAPPAAAPPPAAPPAGATAAAAAGNSAAENAGDKNSRNDQAEGAPSIISVEVLGYGGGDGDGDEEKKAANAAVAPVQASL